MDRTPEQLLESLRELHLQMATAMRERWNRDLPFGELIGDRWQRARRLGFGEGASVYDQCYVFGDVQVGEGAWIGPGTVLDGSGGLRIGAHTHISTGTMIFTHDTVQRALSGNRLPPDTAPVSIGERCYIGSQSTIVKGVTIGDQCVIGAGSILTRDIPARSVAFGSPCRVVGRVEDDVDGRYRLVYDAT